MTGHEGSANRLLDGLTPAERERLVQEVRRRRGTAGASGIVANPRETDATTFRLSSAQHRLWFLEKLNPGDPRYIIPRVVRLHGLLDRIALERALSAVLQRHEALRTAFAHHGGSPVQHVSARGVARVEEVDLTSLVLDDREEAWHAQVDDAAKRPFDLGSEAPVRMSLIRIAENEHVLVIILHHMISDGWSMGVLMRDLSAAYGAFAEGNEPRLVPLRIQYADYSEWQHGFLESDECARQLAYWRSNLLDATPLLEMPTDWPRPSAQSYIGSSRLFSIDSKMGLSLKLLARTLDATPFMVLLAAFAVVLHRYTAQKDVVIGVPIANRNLPEVEDVFGLFVNTLPHRIRINGNPTMRALVAHARETSLGAQSHQDVPYERIVEEIHPDRNLAHSPLFQVWFALQNVNESRLDLSGIECEPVHVPTKSSKFDLSLFLTPRQDGGFDGEVEYATDLFDEARIERFSGHFHTVLQAVLADPDTDVASLPLLAEAEKLELSALSSGPSRSASGGYDLAKPLHVRIEEQAARTPGAVAVIADTEDGSQAMTYAELAARSDALATRLSGLGVGVGDFVAVAMERSCALSVALLGVLKSGAAYLPLDPTYPAERLRFMLSDSSAAAIVVEVSESREDGLGGTLGTASENLPHIQLSASGELADYSENPDPSAPRSASVSGSDAAYMIYTSGSTGQPKGVVVEHGSIVNRLCWMQEAFGLEEGERVLQKTPTSFDVSVWELFWPLMTGGTLVYARPNGHKDPGYLAGVMSRHAVAFVHFVPSMLRVFLDARPASLKACTALRVVVCSGEALLPELVADFYRLADSEGLSEARLHNLYGPTEAAVEVTHWACPPNIEAPPVVPIGRPIANTFTTVVDESGVLVPKGVWGELVLGGVQVARGYHNRPELTAERFPQDPSNTAGRLYRTGDVVRWREDGTLEFRGRSDGQVKLRGFRIELGEIEARLVEHPSIAEAAVVVRGEGASAQIVAYVVPAGDNEFDRVALRDSLSRKLPESMIPNVIVDLSEMPLTPSGKLDRGALPEPTSMHIGKSAMSLPTNHFEQLVADVWARCLNLDQVGLDETFFDLGGHSLLALESQRQLSAGMGKEIPLVDLFAYPTVRSLARHLGGIETNQSLDHAKERAAKQRAALAVRNARRIQHEQ